MKRQVVGSTEKKYYVYSFQQRRARLYWVGPLDCHHSQYTQNQGIIQIALNFAKYVSSDSLLF